MLGNVPPISVLAEARAAKAATMIVAAYMLASDELIKREKSRNIRIQWLLTTTTVQRLERVKDFEAKRVEDVLERKIKTGAAGYLYLGSTLCPDLRR